MLSTVTHRLPAAIRRVVAIVAAAVRETAVDNGPRLAAALSYYAIFSIVPLLFLMAAVAGFVLGDPDAVESVVSRVTRIAGAEVGDELESLLQTVRSQRTGTLSIGLALATFTASSIFQQVQGVLATIFHIPQEHRATGVVGWLVRRVIGVVSALVLAIVVFIPIAAVAAIEWLVRLLPSSVDAMVPAASAAIPLVSLLLLMAALGLIFQGLTPIEIPWKAAIRGGATTALLGLTGASLVGVYLSSAGTTGTLGALGGAAVLLFFFYLLAFVFVFGAEVTKVYADYLKHDEIEMPSRREASPRSLRRRGHRDEVAQLQPASPRRQHAVALAAAAVVGWMLGRRR